jgi:hypothetical protein
MFVNLNRAKSAERFELEVDFALAAIGTFGLRPSPPGRPTFLPPGLAEPLTQ